MDNVESWLLLKSIKGVGNKLLFRAFRHFGGVNAILKADKLSLESVLGSKAQYISSDNFDIEKTQKVLQNAKALGLDIISYEDEDYPKSLFSLPDPPPVLFVKGDKKLLKEKSISIVGSRKAVLSAINMTKTLVNTLQTPVVSGGAEGIDITAHMEAIKSNIPTIMVLGFGFLYLKHKTLQDIGKNGVIVSEFLPFEKPSKFTFPQRNRIIAALGESLFVLQASSKSGALISAYWAFKLNKKVYAYIGNPVEEFEGCSMLIRENIARLFISKAQILTDLNLNAKDTKQEGLLSILDKAYTFEELLSKTGFDEDKLTMELAMLEIEGLIRKDGVYFIKV